MGFHERVLKAYRETRRIFRLTRKPKRFEFNETAKITGIGILIIGFIGFIIFLVSQLIRGR